MPQYIRTGRKPTAVKTGDECWQPWGTGAEGEAERRTGGRIDGGGEPEMSRTDGGRGAVLEGATCPLILCPRLRGTGLLRAAQGAIDITGGARGFRRWSCRRGARVEVYHVAAVSRTQ